MPIALNMGGGKTPSSFLGNKRKAFSFTETERRYKTGLTPFVETVLGACCCNLNQIIKVEEIKWVSPSLFSLRSGTVSLRIM